MFIFHAYFKVTAGIYWSNTLHWNTFYIGFDFSKKGRATPTAFKKKSLKSIFFCRKNIN